MVPRRWSFGSARWRWLLNVGLVKDRGIGAHLIALQDIGKFTAAWVCLSMLPLRELQHLLLVNWDPKRCVLLGVWNFELGVEEE